MSTAPKELETSLDKLSLASNVSKAPAAITKNKKPPVAESWEDDELEDLEDDEVETPLTVQESREYPHAPPPTPISPASPYAGRGADRFSQFAEGWSPSIERISERNERRPEKTDAVAKRLIAGALGVRAPKKTEEQKAYEKAIKEKEVKRINMEKEAKKKAEAEAAKAKAAVWED